MKHTHQEEAIQHPLPASKRKEPASVRHTMNEDLIALKQSFLELERHAKAANDGLKAILKGLPKEDMIKRIKQLRLSDKSLNFLAQGIILENGDGEIVYAIEEFKKNRGANEDQTDHLNYLDL